MSIVFGGLTQFFLCSVAAFAAQNAVLGRSLGITRLVVLVEDANMDSLIFCVLLTLIQVISAPLCWAVNLAMATLSFRAAVRPLVFFVCTWMVCEAVRFIVLHLFDPVRGQKMAQMLPFATFNCCVLGTLFICAGQNFNLAQYLGFALGSGVGYYASVMLVTEQQRLINHRSVPAAFRGLPLMLIYIGILALAVYGFTGHGLFI